MKKMTGRNMVGSIFVLKKGSGVYCFALIERQ